ncbi:hypothetical protein MIV080R [Invertebrate iridescent virus 3]|uniref:Putative hydrolase 080R n=1 Tax=Invertebrate iridescent virus 3 TaxID=345201 RepID=080R_IIV3|nr:hypothetical protein MIV080R [Invertebrate iridescent virus 3]Q196Y0.1 RecName: Full=Putative hydrolase 080R [Invertebrate iridescent virus 3]ABF82110.1 hypothetical protein MIV080R [Invertebrate iridescent virus 3]
MDNETSTPDIFQWCVSPFSKITLKRSMEQRDIVEFRIDATILRQIFHHGFPDLSFNLMVITTDRKVFLLERTESFHYPRVVERIKRGQECTKLVETLYQAERDAVRRLTAEADIVPLAAVKQDDDRPESIYIFPGGHCNGNEPVLSTLLREFREETTIPLKTTELRFHATKVYGIWIHDFAVGKTFKNFVFPVKINLSSAAIRDRFRETRHTRNPTFVDIGKSHRQSLLDLVIKVQKIMIL